MVLCWFSPWTLQKFKWFSVIQGHSACVGQQRGRNNTLAGEGSICYTGDSGSHDAIVELAKGCDILIHMNHYFSGTEPTKAYRDACGNHKDNAIIAKRAGAKTLVLVHLLAQIDLPGIREQIVHEIQQVYDGKVIWGEDLMKLDIAGSKVSTIEAK
jgi:ribonuclease Z